MLNDLKMIRGKNNNDEHHQRIVDAELEEKMTSAT
jgi:hypothetical protein